MNRALPVLLALTLAASACGKDDAPTTPTTEVARSNEVYSGQIGVGGSQFYSFQVSSTGTTEVTLTSLRPAGVTTAPVTTVVGLGLGTPAGTDCALANAVTTGPGLVRQITATTNVQVYCVKVADVGNLRSTVDYTVRVVHP